MKTDDQFKNDLIRSDQIVEHTASFLRSKGKTVVIPPLLIRPNVDDRHNYRDGGDLFVMQLIEVKHRPDLNFKTREDFPYQTVIVDDKGAFDSKPQKPYAYIIWNSDETHCFYIGVTSTRKEWTAVTKYDKKAKHERDFYECPIELVLILEK